jgi:hypothetical protein
MTAFSTARERHGVYSDLLSDPPEILCPDAVLHPISAIPSQVSPIPTSTRADQSRIDAIQPFQFGPMRLDLVSYRLGLDAYRFGLDSFLLRFISYGFDFVPLRVNWLQPAPVPKQGEPDASQSNQNQTD